MGEKGLNPRFYSGFLFVWAIKEVGMKKKRGVGGYGGKSIFGLGNVVLDANSGGFVFFGFQIYSL